MKMLLIISLVYLCSDFILGGDPYYVAEWSDVIKSCPDFENKRYNCDDVELGSAQASGEDDAELLLKGKLILEEDLEDGITMKLQLSKCTEFGDEPMYSAEGDFCTSLKNPDTPWYPLVKTFNSTSCPIRKGEYSLDGLTISIDFAKDVINHEFCGEYKARLAMSDNMSVVSCYIVGLAVVEKSDDEYK